MRNVAKQVRFFFKDQPKRLIPTFFADEDLRRILDPVDKGWAVSVAAGADGVLIDTFDKVSGKGLLGWMTLKEIKTFVRNCHSNNQEAWIAGSITKDQMPALWKTGVDVICVRGAACETGRGRLGKVRSHPVSALLATISQ